MTEHSGIILKTFFPKKRAMAVLDSTCGKTLYVPDTEQVCLGALISYRINRKHSTHFITGIEHVAVPFNLARSDILFFHHVLELCYYFMPLESTAPDVFALVQQLYQPYDGSLGMQYKKLFLAHLFILMGIQPEGSRERWPNLMPWLHAEIDIAMNHTLDLEFDNELHEWLRCCLAMHPWSAQFKTSHFLD